MNQVTGGKREELRGQLCPGLLNKVWQRMPHTSWSEARRLEGVSKECPQRDVRAERLLSAQILMHSAWGARKKFSLHWLCTALFVKYHFGGPCPEYTWALGRRLGSYILEKGYWRTAIFARDSRDFPGKVNHGLEGGLTLPHSGSANIEPGFHSLDTQGASVTWRQWEILKRF